MKNFTWFFFLLFIFTTFLGCEAIAPLVSIGVQAYVTWKDGEATAYYATDANSAYESVKRTIVGMGYKITTDTPDSKGSYSIVAGSKDKFKIHIVKIEPYVTAIKIRVDFMGDKPYAELIYKKLEGQLDVIDYASHHKRWKHIIHH